MSIGCDYENVLEQELFKIRKSDNPDITNLKVVAYRPQVHDYKILSETYEEDVEVQNPCNPDDPTDKIRVKANLKKIIIVADVHYNILLVTDDPVPEIYDAGRNHKMTFDIYATVSADQPVPDILNITPVFDLIGPNRVIVENEDELDFYTFTVDGKVDLIYS